MKQLKEAKVDIKSKILIYLLIYEILIKNFWYNTFESYIINTLNQYLMYVDSSTQIYY